MIFILGFIVVMIPLILIVATSRNKYIGLAHAIITIIFFQTALAVILQTFHLFIYPFVLMGNLLGICFLSYFLARHFVKRGNLFSFNVDWGLIAIFVFSLFCLIQVHYNYTGKITDIKNDRYIEVKHLNYAYPYFSDEWYEIAFIKESIKSHQLPFKNPFYQDVSFFNLEFASQSFLSQVTVLLKLDPLRDYVKLTIFFNALIICLIYVFFRYIQIPILISWIAASSALFITNGSNLPGIWTLIPLSLGVIPLIVSLFYLEDQDIKMASGAAFVALIFYPPLIVIIAPALMTFMFIHRKKGVFHSSMALSYVLLFLTVIFIVSLSLLLANHTIGEEFSYLISKLTYRSFTKDGMTSYPIWQILPWPVMAFALLGFLHLDEGRSWLKVMALVGLLYWAVYAFVPYRVIIEYQRDIYVTSLLLVILAGIGLNGVYIPRYLKIAIPIFICVISLNYTSREEWKNLTLDDQVLHQKFLPSSPANIFLTDDDLRIFNHIHSKSFLSTPWKGTVIGVSTDAYPRCTKEGSVTINKDQYEAFISTDCGGKERIEKIWGIKYFYTPPFSCGHFIEKDKSSEGLVLYEYQS